MVEPASRELAAEGATMATQPGLGITQADMIHRLPEARVVDRIEYLTDAVRGRRAVHVGFVDSGCLDYHERTNTWLHAHLDRAATSLVGLDLDAGGVEIARRNGFEGHAVDCTDPAAVAALGIDPAQVAVAGEVIEHLDRGGDFLDALHAVVEPGGRLIVTTPNASGLLNAAAAALAGFEVNHPDHVTLYSCYTLTNLLERHGWCVDEVATYVPVVHDTAGMRRKDRILGAGARVLLSVERTLGRLRRPFAADGLIVSAHRSTSSGHPGAAPAP
jgi:SAM-dependent methyltransferase